MSAKMSKKTTVTTSSVSSSHGPLFVSSSTPASLSASASARPSSPLSPTRLSRLQEKEELGWLNDRLACYIDRVRHLEQENSRLQIQVQTSQETTTREVTSIKSMYETELTDARRALDELAKDKAKLQIDLGTARSQAEDFASRLAKKEKDFTTAEKNAVYFENKVQELQSRLNQTIGDRKRLEDELKDLKAENDKMNKQLTAIRKQLEDETLKRIDLENRLQSLREELSFRDSVHEKEMIETRTRKQVEISEIDGRLQQQYEQKLADSLRELREEYEGQMRMNRVEIESMYESKLAEVKKLSESNLGSSATAREELRQSRIRVETLTTRLNELERENQDLLNRIKNLESQLEDMLNAHMALNAGKDEELRRLKELLAQQFREYQDLMDIKIGLDLELAAYRKLLEGEEARLNITPAQSPRDRQGGFKRGTPIRLGARTPKRRRFIRSEDSETSNFVSQSSAKGDVELIEQDTDGKYVKLHNKGDKDISIGAWQLHRKAGNEETLYKFHRSTNLKAGQFITVWSAESEATHNPPSDLVMKSQKWVIGDSIHTTLINNNQEEMATRETTRQVMSMSMLRSSDGTYLEDGTEEGDPENPERCVIM